MYLLAHGLGLCSGGTEEQPHSSSIIQFGLTILEPVWSSFLVSRFRVLKLKTSSFTKANAD